MFAEPIEAAESVSATPLAMDLPPAREFLTSAGFGGALALGAVLLLALIVSASSWRTSKRHRQESEQRERHHEVERAEKERAADLAVCEQRFKWVVETAGIEPAFSESATLGLGPELALELLSGLHSDAKRLDDETLAKAIGVYLSQFALVLAQQGGPLAGLKSDRGSRGAGGSRAAAKPRATTQRSKPEPEPNDAPATEQIPALESDTDPPAHASPSSAAGRRRRR